MNIFCAAKTPDFSAKRKNGKATSWLKFKEQTNNIYYDNFVPKVAAGRSKTPEEVNAIGQGHVWTGTQAKQNGLIDDFGGLEKAIAVAKHLAESARR